MVREMTGFGETGKAVPVHISAHAVERYQERVGGFVYAIVREAIYIDLKTGNRIGKKRERSWSRRGVQLSPKEPSDFFVESFDGERVYMLSWNRAETAVNVVTVMTADMRVRTA